MSYGLLAVAAVALILSIWLSIQVASLRRRLEAVPQDGDVIGMMREMDTDLAAAEAAIRDLQPRVTELEAKLPLAVCHVGVVSYDAFGNITGNMSRSFALLDRQGNGLVLSVLVGRAETMFYTKQVRGARGTEELSPEEEAAIERAMTG
jgi:hypothetical protein